MAKGNLGPTEQRKRLILGIAGVVAGFGVAVSGFINSPYGWVVLFVLFWLGAFGLLQAKEKT